MGNTINFIAAVVALVAAVIGLWTAFENRVQIEQQGQQIESQDVEITKQKLAIDKQAEEIFRMRALASSMALEVTIDRPTTDEEIDAVYDKMRGSFQGQIPKNHNLWVLARDRHNYFLMYPPTQIVHSKGQWSQKNIRLGSPGSWELVLCVANAEASLWLQTKADKQDWGGFPSLPAGLEIIGSVEVLRK